MLALFVALASVIKSSEGRRGVAGRTSLLNIDEEHLTSERMVNVVFVYMLNGHGQPLMPCPQGSPALETRQGKGSEDGSLHPPTALWQ